MNINELEEIFKLPIIYGKDLKVGDRFKLHEDEFDNSKAYKKSIDAFLNNGIYIVLGFDYEGANGEHCVNTNVGRYFANRKVIKVE